MSDLNRTQYQQDVSCVEAGIAFLRDKQAEEQAFADNMETSFVQAYDAAFRAKALGDAVDRCNTLINNGDKAHVSDVLYRFGIRLKE
jgi:hypothetical protein